jgi:hypothetical protein
LCAGSEKKAENKYILLSAGIDTGLETNSLSAGSDTELGTNTLV